MPFPVELDAVTVRAADGRPLLRDLSLTIPAGQFVALIGRSGAGKTTALRLMNGLVTPASGRVFVGGSDLAATDLVSLRRRVGYVVQNVGLFPHRTVFDNIAVVPRLLGWPEEKIREAAAPLLELVLLPLETYGDRFPRTLSGGEQQRVGVVRSVIAEPDLLLCDEPFGALDPIVRSEQQAKLLALRETRSATVVFVTHDLGEALLLAERVILMDEGAIVVDTRAAEFAANDHPLARRFVESARLPGVA